MFPKKKDTFQEVQDNSNLYETSYLAALDSYNRNTD